MNDENGSPDAPPGSHYRETGIQDRAPTPSTEGELPPAKEYAEMIVDSLRESLLILDLDLRVQAANQSYYDWFRAEPEETVGCSLFELGGGQWNLPRLRLLLEDLLPEDKTINDYEVEGDFEGLGRRTLLLNTRQVDDHELILLAIEDVTERRKTRRELEELTEKLEERVEECTRQVQELASALSAAEEKERRRISDILHDHLQQLLFGAEMSVRQVHRLANRITDPEIKEKQTQHLHQLEELLEEATHETKTLSVELSPPIAAGKDLPTALEWLAGHMGERHGLAVELDLAERFQTPGEDMRTFLFQMTRELLFNVVKHADVEEACVSGKIEGTQLVLCVQDEGHGFDKRMVEENPTSKGLHDLRRRLKALGGTMNIDSATGEGTRVTIRVNLPRHTT